MLNTHASIFSDVSVDSLTPDDSDVEVAAMSCMEIGSDDESDDDIPYRPKILSAENFVHRILQTSIFSGH